MSEIADHVIRTYVIQVFAPLEELIEMPDFPGIINETEENLSDLFPDGYYVRISEWDEED